MQAIFETIFDIVYLILVIIIGITMIKKGRKNKQFYLFGIMATVLGFGDAFHLVPRMLALCNGSFEKYALYLGLGKMITSLTMTIFYVLLYYVWCYRYKIKNHQKLDIVVYILAFLRMYLCLLPQNKWLNNSSPLKWGIIRNIPFTLLGLLVIILFYKSAKENKDKAFKWMWLTIVLSFGFYIPVVLWADKNPLIGMLMMPKTIAYVWTVFIGYNAMKKEMV